MKKAFLLLPVLLIGCANPIRDGINNLRTSVRNGFQEMRIEVSPSVSNVAKLDDMKIEAVLDDRFSLNGYVTYPKSCATFLTMTVRYYAADGSAIGTAAATSRSYRAGERAKFMSSYKAVAKGRNELISKAVIDDLRCV